MSARSVRSHRREIAVVIALPLIAGIVSMFLLMRQPQQYRASSLVTVPSAVTGNATPTSVGQYIANFDGAITSSAVAAEVARAIGSSESDVVTRLAAGQVGKSNVIKVTFVGTDQAKAEQAVGVAASRALQLMAVPTQARAKQAVQAAQQRLALAQKRYEQEKAGLAKLASPGQISPTADYASKLSQLSNLEASYGAQKAQSIGAINGVFAQRASSLLQEVTKLRSELAAAAAAATAYKLREDSLQAASDAYSAAQQALTQAETGLATVGAVAPPSQPSSDTISRTGQFIQGVILVMLLALILALGIVLIPLIVRLPARVEASQRQQELLSGW